MQLRHGDVFLEKVTSVPKGAKKLARMILAYGEATGHAHRVDQGQLYQDAQGNLWFKAPKGAALTHEEHARIDVSPGVWKVTIQREYAPGELPRQVVD